MTDSTATPGHAPDLAGQRVLVVEDRDILARETVRLLERLGCEAVGPAPDLAGGFGLLAREDARGGRLDAAVLGVHLGDHETVYPLAVELRRRGVPFLFVTGYRSAAIPEAWRDAPRLEKPLGERAFEAALRSFLAERPSPDRPGAETSGAEARGVRPDDTGTRDVIDRDRSRARAGSIARESWSAARATFGWRPTR